MTTLAYLFFQTPTPSITPPTPEKLPAWLTLIYLIGIGVVGLLLLLSLLRAWFSRSPSALTAPANLPKAVRIPLGATATNLGFGGWRWRFSRFAILTFGFHF